MYTVKIVNVTTGKFKYNNNIIDIKRIWVSNYIDLRRFPHKWNHVVMIPIYDIEKYKYGL